MLYILVGYECARARVEKLQDLTILFLYLCRVNL